MFAYPVVWLLLLLPMPMYLLFRWLVRRGLAPVRRVESCSPAALGLAYAEVTIPTTNGKRLFAWYVAADRDYRAPAVVVLHGWGGNAEMMLPLLAPLHQAGFAVLLVDARCHGQSDDDAFTSLPRFAEDLASAFDWLKDQSGVDVARIGLIGHSVGAGAALLLGARRRDVGAIVSLSAFAHPVKMTRRLLAVKGIPYMPFGWAVLRYVEGVIGHRFDDIAPQTSIGDVACPVLLVHGADDATVPVAEAQAIHAARSGEHVRLEIVAGSHEEFGDGDADGEIAVVVGFLRDALDA